MCESVLDASQGPTVERGARKLTSNIIHRLMHVQYLRWLSERDRERG